MTGILLAAGFSRRFGSEDKLLQLLPDGRCMAEAAAQNLIKAIPLSIAVVRIENETLAKRLQTIGLNIVYCNAQQTGMGDSLAAAVRYAAGFAGSATGFVVALADMPYIKPETISAVTHALETGAAIAAPTYRNQRGHPVGFGTQFRNELELLTGDEGARSIVKRHVGQLTLLECDDPGILTDIDTPQDLIIKLHT